MPDGDLVNVFSSLTLCCYDAMVLQLPLGGSVGSGHKSHVPKRNFKVRTKLLENTGSRE